MPSLFVHDNAQVDIYVRILQLFICWPNEWAGKGKMHVRAYDIIFKVRVNNHNRFVLLHCDANLPNVTGRHRDWPPETEAGPPLPTSPTELSRHDRESSKTFCRTTGDIC